MEPGQSFRLYLGPVTKGGQGATRGRCREPRQVLQTSIGGLGAPCGNPLWLEVFQTFQTWNIDMNITGGPGPNRKATSTHVPCTLGT